MVAEPVILLFEGMHGAPDQFQLVSTHTSAHHFFLSSIGFFFWCIQKPLTQISMLWQFLLPTMPTWLHSGQGATWTQRHQILGQ
jgi:hypothetical protein